MFGLYYVQQATAKAAYVSQTNIHPFKPSFGSISNPMTLKASPALKQPMYRAIRFICGIFHLASRSETIQVTDKAIIVKTKYKPISLREKIFEQIVKCWKFNFLQKIPV